MKYDLPSSRPSATLRHIHSGGPANETLVTPPPPLDRLTALAAALVALTLLPTLATADVVPAHNNYKPTIVMDRTGPNVLTGCGEHGRVATLRIRVPPPQKDGNAWNGTNALQIQATTDAPGSFERRTSIVGERWLPWEAEWDIVNLAEGEHTVEVRTRTGQNIGYGGGGEMSLKLVKHPNSLNNPQVRKHRVFSPAIRILAAGGKGCQTRADNPTCRGFWDWTGGMPTCLLE